MTALVDFNKEQNDRAMTSIEKFIAHPPENSRVFTITPDMATEILERYNEGNRAQKPVKIAEYADHMSADTWMLTGDTIKFSDEKILRDGQNRLRACVRSGSPFRTHVVFGVDDGAFAFMDRGRNRSASDILKIAGYSYTTTLAQALKWSYMLETESVNAGRGTYEQDFILRLVQERYPAMPDFIPAGLAVQKTLGIGAGIISGLYYQIRLRDEAKADDFIQAMAAGLQDGKYRPIGLAIQRLAQLRAAGTGGVRDRVKMAILIAAWNAFRKGQKGSRSRIDYAPGMTFPSIEG